MNNFLRYNTPFGLLMGFVFVIAAFTAYNTQNKILDSETLNSSISLLSITGLFIQIRNYREKKGGLISYWKAVCTGIWIIVVAAFVNSCYIYYMYSQHSDLLNNYVELTKLAVENIYSESDFKEEILKHLSEIISPALLGFFDFISKLLVGTIYSLTISIFAHRRILQHK